MIVDDVQFGRKPLPELGLDYHPVRDTAIIAGATVGVIKGPGVVVAIGEAAGPVVAPVIDKGKQIVNAIGDKVSTVINSFGSNNSTTSSIINNINPNTANHIMQSKHAWDLVGANDWNNVSNVISTVLTKGTGVVNSVGNVIYSYNCNEQTVEVTTRVVDGAMRVVDAWVKTR